MPKNAEKPVIIFSKKFMKEAEADSAFYDTSSILAMTDVVKA